jgi:hypothetical protein
MRTMTKGLGILIAVLCLAAGSYADTFNWNYTATDGSGVTAGGTLTASPIGSGEDLISAITGTYRGSTITSLLAPGTCCSSPANDNDLFYPGAPHLDLGGFGFGVGTLQVDIYDGGGTYFDCTSLNRCTGPDYTAAGTFTVSRVSQVPEPATLGMLFVGLLTLCLLGARYKENNPALEASQV